MDVSVDVLPGKPRPGASAIARLRALLGRAAADPSVRIAWKVFWRSRLLIWVTGCAGVLIFGTSSGAVTAFDPTGVSKSFGAVGNVLAAPAVRWDSVWYLQIAHDGYHTARETAFYPLYPLLMKLGSFLVGSMVAAGILISLVALMVSLVLVYRLSELELGSTAAAASVTLLAFGPLAVFKSAVYTEALFLALSAGTFYAARTGRWAIAGVLGGLAAMTRVTGVLLIVPMVLLFFYGPRSDVSPIPRASRLMPRYAFSPAVLWSALIPGGLGLFSIYLTLRGFGPTGMLRAQEQFSAHHLAGPLAGIWQGTTAAWHELMLETSGMAPSTYSNQAMLQFATLLLSGAATIGVLRRLPPAYGAYVLLGLLVPLSSPTLGDPLRGLDRYVALLFPLYMWSGAWAGERRLVRTAVLAMSGILILFTVQFATWHWVG
jgi:hypothetical protein